MFARSLRLTRVAGIDVRLDPSLLLFAVLIAWVFGANFLVRHGAVATAVMALAATVLFLASVLAHELAHGLEARYRGIRVQGITLFFFGGMTEMHADSRTPRDEFAVSAVGPYASLLCAAAFGLVATLAADLGPVLAGPVGDVAGLLAWLNLFLAVFNLVPGAPLDGGRVLRAGLWWLLGDRHRAVRIAGRAGQLLAGLLAATGLWLLAAGLLGDAAGRVPVVSRLGDSPVMGIVLLLVGAFILQAARTELARGETERVLDERSVADLLAATPAPVLADLDDAGAPSRPEVAPQAPLRMLVDHLLAGHESVAVRSEGQLLAVLRKPEVARGLHRLRRGGQGARRPRPERTGPEAQAQGTST